MEAAHIPAICIAGNFIRPEKAAARRKAGSRPPKAVSYTYISARMPETLIVIVYGSALYTMRP